LLTRFQAVTEYVNTQQILFLVWLASRQSHLEE
jgi:hypothetical protein